ncbi:type II toxin-antitoxin system VapC family toxin [Gaiella sp.]|uniref:type II toxin-antitoxin system VapC family toxin n=1 Tax=Gaiella sp. TaxID=2663207 RepID=UPI002E32F5A4|nr:type II toxin-antitoxin system VapC family toxin [Gaiella sp.]HEX5585658.1 type II toxin-antitoxin system VapC family toxin [Gaiella sp.]
MSAYFDTSSFVKLFLPEPGSAQVRSLWVAASPCVSSVALVAEALAALGRARWTSRLSHRNHVAMVRQALDRWAEMEPLELTEPLARRAGELAEVYALRGYDAIHLASAEAILDEGDVMIVSDTRLAEAAASIGIAALVPAT